MNFGRKEVDQSYRFCRCMTRQSRSSFYPCFAVLPRAKRRAMDAIYAFMRHTDDIVDCEAPLDHRRNALARWRDAVSASLCETTPLPGPGKCGHIDPAVGEDRGRAMMPALADAVRRYAIPVHHLFAVIDGVEMDLDRHCYATFEELAEYCHRVASAVGLACIHVWGYDGEEPLEPARQCGLAFQLTNILRDLREDAGQGRIYLPEEDLQRYGYGRQELAAGVADARFDRLVEFEVARIRDLYRQGARLVERLSPDGRRVFGLMVSVYYRLLEEIASRPHDVLHRRVSLGLLPKMRIAGRWLILPPRRLTLP